MEMFIELLPIGMLLALAILLFSGLPIGFILAGVGIGFAAIGISLDQMNYMELYSLSTRAFHTVGESLIYPAVPMLLFMGLMLERSGIARDLLLCLQVLLRRLPANLAISLAVLGLILAPSAGLIGASVATLTLIAMPTMLSQGYKPSFAAGAIAASGTLGIIFPPAIMLFFLADLLNVTMGFMLLAPVVPVFLLLTFYIAYFVLVGTFKPEIAPQVKTASPLGAGELFLYAFRSLVLPIGLILLILGSIVGGFATPTQSGAVGAAGALLVTTINRTLSFTLLKDVLRQTTTLTCMVFFVVIAASMFSYTFRSLYGDQIILELLSSLGLGSWGTLAMILVIIFLLGFVIDWIEIALITLPIFYPLLEQLDFSANFATKQEAFAWIAVLIAINLQTSFMTPPFGFALFFLKGSAPPSVTMMQIYRGIVPFVFIQLSVLGLVMIFPWLATALPSALTE